MEKVNLSEAIISINAKSNAATIAIITCLVGELTFSKGTRDFITTECHSGESTSTGILKYPEGAFEIIYDSADAYEAQVMLEEALLQTGDFASDNTLEMNIEFNNSKGTSGAMLDVEMLIGSFDVVLTANGDSKVSCTYKQLAPFTSTAATGP